MVISATVRKISKPLIQKPLKSALIITPSALLKLRSFNSTDNNKFVKISVRKKGCSGSSYFLSLVDNKHDLDEVVEQEDVKVVIDHKAMLSILGSEMDYVEDKLSSMFVFNNPNIKDTCGCGQSFLV